MNELKEVIIETVNASHVKHPVELFKESGEKNNEKMCKLF